MSPRDGHVITVSGCLILTAANSSSYGWLTKCQFLQDVTVDISLHEVCVRVGVLYVITKFSRMDGLPNFLTHGATQARASLLDIWGNTLNLYVSKSKKVYKLFIIKLAKS